MLKDFRIRSDRNLQAFPDACKKHGLKLVSLKQNSTKVLFGDDSNTTDPMVDAVVSVVSPTLDSNTKINKAISSAISNVK